MTTKSLTELLKPLRFWFKAIIAISILSAFTDALELVYLRQDLSAESSPLFLAGLMILTGLGFIIAGSVGAIFFFRWIHRAHYNERLIGSPDVTKASWAVWHYFIPILNLFRPLQNMRRLWALNLNEASNLLGMWWTLVWVSGIANRASTRAYFSASTFSEYIIANGLSILGYTLGIGVIFCLIKITTQLSEAQDERLAEAIVIEELAQEELQSLAASA